jgi:predicted transcriptional regulator
MTLRDIAQRMDLEVRAGADRLDREVTGGYVSDLLSDVMAHSEAGDVWVTLQIHENTVAVASLRELAGVILVGGREPEEETVRRANAEGVPILVTPLRSYEVVAGLIGAGVKGKAIT